MATKGVYTICDGSFITHYPKMATISAPTKFKLLEQRLGEDILRGFWATEKRFQVLQAPFAIEQINDTCGTCLVFTIFTR